MPGSSERWPLCRGEGEALQGAILIDAHLAASAIGATPTARPEDTKIGPISGELLIAFTSGSPGGKGGADPAVFRGPQGQSSWGHGWVMRLTERGDRGFRWTMAVTGGEPWAGGLGLTNPDNLALDQQGNLWIVTDRSMKSAAGDVFGNNSCWWVPRDGGSALCFATGPMECELTGVCLDQEESSLLLAAQHPGEVHGARVSCGIEFQLAGSGPRPAAPSRCGRHPSGQRRPPSGGLSRPRERAPVQALITQVLCTQSV